MARIETLGNQLKRNKERMPKNPLGVGMQQGAEIQYRKNLVGRILPQNSWGEKVEAPRMVGKFPELSHIRVGPWLTG